MRVRYEGDMNPCRILGPPFPDIDVLAFARGRPSKPCRLTVHDGDGMSADRAAWATIADSALRALKFPGLSAATAAEMRKVAVACRAAAGLDRPRQ